MLQSDDKTIFIDNTSLEIGREPLVLWKLATGYQLLIESVKDALKVLEKLVYAKYGSCSSHFYPNATESAMFSSYHVQKGLRLYKKGYKGTPIIATVDGESTLSYRGTVICAAKTSRDESMLVGVLRTFEHALEQRKQEQENG